MQNTLDSLIRRAEEKFQFDAKQYPELEGFSDAEILSFAIRHSALHFSKIAGKIASYSEDVDHGCEGNMEELKTDVAKSLLNTLRLAGLLQMNEQELVERIENKLGDPTSS